ncbi:hypothetical protein [Pseudidiomarina woesei]|uniref:Plasmid stabilization system protein ParE n=1 Tax=Pseudidiomarina woesei TaxID=1381080 RepID=A0A0K6GYK9_9GAMM|nr:hypothetical protein [Pseudidiomarina woesei]CUA83826.1 hypothetical protein Ga0061064_0782 [Pseudidiomarina woesei]
MTISIDYTTHFKSQAREHVRFLTKKVGYRLAQQYVDTVLDRFEQKIYTFPQGCARCQESAELGFGQYYESIDTKAQVRIIYRLVEGDDALVSTLLFIRTRQNLRDQLFQLVLMSP